MSKGLIDRFNQFVDKISSDSGCWLWTGSTHKQGYGKISFRGKTQPSHRISYELFNGSIPKNMMVCHKCDNTKCVNPRHLFLGTAMDNMQDKVSKGRHKGAKQGSLHHKSKLTEFAVKEIINSNMNQYQLAEIHGVSQSTISSIKAGKKWRHVERI